MHTLTSILEINFLERCSLQLACDEAGHTGPDLLASDQRIFAFASVAISDDEAFELIQKARTAHPIQMPELKAARLIKSSNGRRLIAELVSAIEGRFAINAHDKLLALCGWMFEYIFEPVYQNDPRIFYQRDFHRFVAMFAYLWFMDSKSGAPETIRQFQAFMRSKDIAQAPALFQYSGDRDDENAHPFDLVRRFATAHRVLIAEDVRDIENHVPDQGVWTLDLSASSFWSHCKHWSSSGEALAIICDDSKPLRPMADRFAGEQNEGILRYIEATQGKQISNWKLERPIEFVDSRTHPSVQLADILASTTVQAFARGVPDDFRDTASILDSAMLQDSIFPDFDRVRLERPEVQVNYAVLFELTKTAEESGTGLPLETYFALVEDSIAAGNGPKFS